MSRIIGVDPGSLHTGYGIVEMDGRRLQMVASGTIHLSSLHSFPERLGVIYNKLSSIIREIKPDSMAIEDVFFATNPRTALKLGQARGAAILSAVNERIPVYEYSPLEIKQAVVGYGRANKNQVYRMVITILGLPKVEDSHTSDALAVAICHLHCRQVLERNKPK